MKKVSLPEVLTLLSSVSQKSLRPVIDDHDVEYLIVLESPGRDRKKILPAGPNLDFRSPNDARGQVIHGMRASCYVELAESRQLIAKEASIAETKESTELNRLKTKIGWLENANHDLETRVSNAKKQILTRDTLIEELKKQVQSLQNHVDSDNESSEGSSEVDRIRKTDIEKAEEELISRMDEYMQKEAELEQREENLFYRERKLHEKEQNNTRTA